MGKRPIRVLEIISGFAIEGPLGGIERFGMELAQALHRQSTRIEPLVCGMWFYDTPYEVGWRDFLREQGIEAFETADWDYDAPYMSFWQSYQGARTYLEGQQIDIIHSHCQFGDLLALALYGRVGAEALIRTVHNEQEWGKRPGRRILLTNGLYPWRFDLEMGVAQVVVDTLNERPVSRWLGREAVKSYNALNLDRFQQVEVDVAAKRASLGLPPEAKVIGTIGRLAEQKGYHVLLEAAVHLLEKEPDSYFLLIGTGHLEAELKQKARELGVDGRVLFLGARNDVEELLKIIDVFVNSSLWEGLPTVILESMAAGIPVVATDVSGNLELVLDGETGLLAPAGNPHGLAERIYELLEMAPADVERICGRAFAYVQANFSIRSIAEQHEEIYVGFVKGK